MKIIHNYVGSNPDKTWEELRGIIHRPIGIARLPNFLFGFAVRIDSGFIHRGGHDGRQIRGLERLGMEPLCRYLSA